MFARNSYNSTIATALIFAGVLLGVCAFGAPAGAEVRSDVSCFDYYTFGSVQADLVTTVTETVAGSTMHFSGVVRNTNPYPIVEGALYVKVFRLREEGDVRNGADVVDQFFVKRDINITANTATPVSFDWTVPAYAQTGNYQVATYFTTAQKYNLLGLSFTDDVVGNLVDFSVIGEGLGAVQFEKDTVTLNEEAYVFGAYPPRMGADEAVEGVATLSNTTNVEQNVKISRKTYYWDALRHENLVEEEEQMVTVPAGGSREVTFTVRDAKYPVYLTVLRAEWKDTTSFLNIRFAREDIARARINFPAVTTYPLVEGQAAELFSCFHAASVSSGVDDATLILKVLDKDGGEVHSAEYSGPVTGEMMAMVDTFTPEETLDSFTVQAYLFDGGNVVDEEHLTYDCRALGGCSAAAVGQISFVDTLGLGKVSPIVLIAGGIILLVIVIALARSLLRKEEGSGDFSSPQDPATY